MLINEEKERRKEKKPPEKYNIYRYATKLKVQSKIT
jgi:hypothetical protein